MLLQETEKENQTYIINLKKIMKRHMVFGLCLFSYVISSYHL